MEYLFYDKTYSDEEPTSFNKVIAYRIIDSNNKVVNFVRKSDNVPVVPERISLHELSRERPIFDSVDDEQYETYVRFIFKKTKISFDSLRKVLYGTSKKRYK